MYVKIVGNLIDILGEYARGDIEGLCGLKLSPQYQSTEGEELITLGEVVNEQKASIYLNHPNVEILETKEDFNAAIDEYFKEKYILVDSTALLLSLQLSGKTVANIEGYNPEKPMEDQQNLKALFEAGLSGIKKKAKPPYIE